MAMIQTRTNGRQLRVGLGTELEAVIKVPTLLGSSSEKLEN
jgi:hypothetical protein